MNLRQRNKVSAEFNMSSLTDIIFLLLIFFMLTSTLVNPNVLNLLLPNSDVQSPAKQHVSVSIDEEQNFYVKTEQVSEENLQASIRAALNEIDTEEPTIVLNAEKSVPIEKIVAVMNVANEMKIQMVLATNPK